MAEIHQARFAIIGGSSTNSIDFPGEAGYDGVEIIKRRAIFDTPYGKSPAFTLFSLKGKTVLTCRMHGWRAGVTRANASRQLFWVLREAGVERILGEGGVGAIDPKLELRDIVVPDDYIDLSMRRDVSLDSQYLLVMRDALCREERAALLEAARAHSVGRVIERGVYVVTDGRHFESPAEVRMLRSLGGDIIGQSLAPEVYLAREIGACYGSIQIIVNYAEGVVEEWSHEELASIFYGEAGMMSRILLEALDSLPAEKSCPCVSLRKPSLLKEKAD
ncbi:MAG: MTAP family purine nucleoside phosphorylase [Actinobacteria bacterium]|nr:MTAP family purine nucleoside phosphorylase [Actinomycetota bacterium]